MTTIPTQQDLYALTDVLGRAGLLHDPLIAGLLVNITPDHDSPLNRRLWQDLTQRFSIMPPPPAPAIVSPFAPPPPGLVSDRPITVGYEATTGEPVTVGGEDIASTVLLPGATGSGKTTIILSILSCLVTWVRLLILDLKDDYRSLAATDPRTVVLHPDAPYNILTPPRHLSVAQADDLFTTTVARSLYMGQHGKGALSRALASARADHDTPCIHDLITAIERSTSRQDTFTDRDTKRGLADRLQRFSQAYPGLAMTRGGFTIADILGSRSLHLSAAPLTEHEEFLFSFHALHLFLYQRDHRRRGGLDYVLVNDEGLQTWNASNTGRINDAPLLLPLLGMTRELGIGALISTNSWTSTHDALKSNANTLLITRLASMTDERDLSRTIGLNREQQEYLNRQLGPGQAIVRLRDRWREPLLAIVPPLNYDKNVTPTAWEAAKARTNLLAPTINPTAIRTNHAPSVIDIPSQHEQDPTSSTPTTDTCRPRATVQPEPTAKTSVQNHATPTRSTTPYPAPPKPTPTQPAPTPTPAGPASIPVTARSIPEATLPISLTAAEEALLRVVCDRVTPSTPAYRTAGLSLSEGDQAAKRLEQKALITRERIVLHAGRGGHGIGLAATNTGYERAGKHRATRTRGGDGVQHQYFIQELHHALPGSTVEALVGNKSVDLLVPLSTTRDQRLLTFLAGKTSAPLKHGDLLALEVETSSPAKTAPSNVTKNHDAGITLTLTLVLPADQPATNRALTGLPQDTFLVTNVLSLLAALKG